jgi:hypothetical protein
MPRRDPVQPIRAGRQAVSCIVTPRALPSLSESRGAERLERVDHRNERACRAHRATEPVSLPPSLKGDTCLMGTFLPQLDSFAESG